VADILYGVVVVVVVVVTACIGRVISKGETAFADGGLVAVVPVGGRLP
jgi:hypothetical protein